MNKWTRFAALALVLVLLCGLLPQVSLIAHAETYSGNCGKNGDNLKWTLNTESEVLTITGYGEMADYSSSVAPWYSRNDSVKKVILPNGLLNISRNAFRGSWLTELKIPNSVTCIDNNAFEDCFYLETVILGDGVKSIGDEAFQNCIRLADLTIGKNVTSIGESAFFKCKELKKVKIPDKVNTIGSYAFSDCEALNSVAIGRGVTTVENGAFYGCSSLASLSLGTGINTIGETAFYNCYNLTNVTIPNSVTEIGDYAFANCHDITGVKLENGLLRIGDSAFYFCEKLKGIMIPSSVTSIGEKALGFYWDNTVDGFTILGYAGTAAQAYAEENGLLFVGSPCCVTVTPPKAGFHPATTGKTDDLSLYKVTAVYYNLLNADGTEGLDMSSEETFELGKTYRIWVRLTSVSHFEFTDDTTVAINGIPAVNHGVNMGGDAWFTVDMTAEKARPYGDIPLTADYFPDPYFRQYLADKFNANGNDALEQSEICNIRSLHLNIWGENYSNVASLEGVQYLPYVEAIYANHTKITGFDGTGLDDLTALDLSDCPLNSLNLSENACMQELYLADTSGELRDIDLAGMPELLILETYRSSISIMDISRNPHLVDAALYGEETSDGYSKTFRIDRNHYLRTDGYDHNVTVAHFSEAFPDDCFRSLIQGHTDYNWDGNDNLSISEAKNITALDVGDEEEITSLIGVELLPNLEFLAAFNNKLQSVDLRRNTKLNWLDLDNNKLGTLDVSHNTALETLYCQYNELALLNLGNNNVLKSVYAYDNRLTELCLSGVPALEDLDVAMNGLTELNLYSNRKLEMLNCYGNEITQLNISNNPNLISAYKGTRTEVTDSETGITICNYQDGNYNRLSINKGVTVYIDGYRNPFVDVAESDWFFNPVMWAYYHSPQVTAGIDETHFDPGNDCTRAQVVTFLYAAAGKPDFAMPDASFSDVSESDWFYKPVMWALANGVTAGFPDGTFGASQSCTRAQVVTFLYAAAGKPDFAMPDAAFSDVADGDWFYTPVMWAVKNNITSGVGDGKFGPGNTCTRAQIVTFLWAAEGRP